MFCFIFFDLLTVCVLKCSDCGVFTSYFAEQVIIGREGWLPSTLVDVKSLRTDMAVSLYFHAKGKQNDGYITSNEAEERREKKRLKKFNLNI